MHKNNNKNKHTRVHSHKLISIQV